MDFSDKIKQFSKRIDMIKGNLATEEATKTALIMPFFNLLDYDVFNPAAGQYEVIKYLVKCVLLDMRHVFMQNKGLRYISFENNKDPESIYIIAEKKYTDKNIVTLTIGA